MLFFVLLLITGSFYRIMNPLMYFSHITHHTSHYHLSHITHHTSHTSKLKFAKNPPTTLTPSLTHYFLCTYVWLGRKDLLRLAIHQKLWVDLAHLVWFIYSNISYFFHNNKFFVYTKKIQHEKLFRSVPISCWLVNIWLLCEFTSSGNIFVRATLISDGWPDRVGLFCLTRLIWTKVDSVSFEIQYYSFVITFCWTRISSN